jgi:hypothetical protein
MTTNCSEPRREIPGRELSYVTTLVCQAWAVLELTYDPTQRENGGGGGD